jgi:hypothetical protein
LIFTGIMAVFKSPVVVGKSPCQLDTLFITNSPAMPFAWTDTNPATMPAQFYRIKAGPPLP